MAVTSTVNVVKATATAAQTVFDISDFRFFLIADVIVYKDSVVQASGFTTDVDAQTVTFDVPMDGGELLVFERILPETQLILYTVQGKFPAASHEEGLDREVMLIQQLSERQQRGLRIPVTHTAASFSPDLPDPGASENLGKTIALTLDGTGLRYVAGDSSTVITTQGDIPVGAAGGSGTRLPVGLDGQVVGTDGTDVLWVAADSHPQNYILNDDMRLSQEFTSGGVSVTFAANDYVLDQWGIQLSGGEYVTTVTQDTDVPTVAEAGKSFSKSLLVTTTTEETALAAGDFLTIVQPISGNGIQDFFGQVSTLAFWAKSSQTGTFCMFLTNGAATFRSYVKTFTIDAADTWERKTFVFTMEDGTVGTWNTNFALGMIVGITLSSGSTFEGTDGTWETAQHKSVSTCTNTWMTTAALTFRLTGVQLVKGNNTNVAQARGHRETIASLQRYYAKSYSLGTAVGTAETIGAYEWTDPVNDASNRQTVTFPQDMVKNDPTITFYSPDSGTAARYFQITATSGDFVASEASSQTGPRSTALVVGASNGTNQIKIVHWTADARFTL